MKLTLPPIKLKKRETIIAGCLAGLMAAFIFDKVFLSGIRTKLNDLSWDIKKEESRFWEGAKIAHQKEDIRENYERYKNFVDIPRSDKEILTGFLKEVESLVKASGGSVMSFSPRQEQEQKTNCMKYLADLQIEIEPKQLFKFLSSVEESQWLMMVDSLSISPKNEQANLLKVDAVLSMAVYLK
ncbi:MAG TPA: GspMb/PilO family protein [Candidatus Omnitrophota bacterium]|nr:GspMb/PilO family protein [Candidatus Omnitrophota bacterium]